MTDTDYQSDYWWVHQTLCVYKKLRITAIKWKYEYIIYKSWWLWFDTKLLSSCFDTLDKIGKWWLSNYYLMVLLRNI